MTRSDYVRTLIIIILGLWLLPGCASVDRERNRIQNILAEETTQMKWKVYRQTRDAEVFKIYNEFEDRVEQRIKSGKR